MVGVCKNVLGTSMTNRFVLLTVLLLRAMDSMGTTVFQEVTYINDTNTTCEVPQATFQIVGMPGDGLVPFDTCYNESGVFMQYSCNSSDIYLHAYMTDDCSGDALLNEEIVDGDTCDLNNGTMSSTSCVEADLSGYHSASSNWTVEAVFHDDVYCDSANGNSSSFTMDEFMEVAEVNSTTSCVIDNDFFGFNTMVGCVNGAVTIMYFEASDTNCTGDVTAVTSMAPCQSISTSNISTSNISTMGNYVEVECLDVSQAHAGDNDDEEDDDSNASSSVHSATPLRLGLAGALSIAAVLGTIVGLQ